MVENSSSVGFDGVNFILEQGTDGTITRTKIQLRSDAQLANADTLIAKAGAALTANATFLAIGSPSAAQTLAQVQALTRQVNALLRLASNALDSTGGT